MALNEPGRNCGSRDKPNWRPTEVAPHQRTQMQERRPPPLIPTVKSARSAARHRCSQAMRVKISLGSQIEGIAALVCWAR